MFAGDVAELPGDRLTSSATQFVLSCINATEPPKLSAQCSTVPELPSADQAGNRSNIHGRRENRRGGGDRRGADARGGLLRGDGHEESHCYSARSGRIASVRQSARWRKQVEKLLPSGRRLHHELRRRPADVVEMVEQQLHYGLAEPWALPSIPTGSLTSTTWWSTAWSTLGRKGRTGPVWGWKRPTRTTTILPRLSRARLTTSSAAPASTRGSPGRRRSRSRPCRRRVGLGALIIPHQVTWKIE